jgi:hypothetical protein
VIRSGDNVLGKYQADDVVLNQAEAEAETLVEPEVSTDD